ncbi:MAG: four-helix bundle copper-binding protein [Magnetococcales bacterium]|nr:four-helix bundle copper-binding protein [Magnetococcales bacterium]
MSTTTKNQNKREEISRRQVLTGTGTVGAGVLASALLSGSAHANSHNHGNHTMHQGGGMNQMPANMPQNMPSNMPANMPPNVQLMQSAQNCLTAANICVNHCITLISQGDTSLRECLRTASEMIPSCNTLGQLASMNTKHLKKYVEYCLVVCEECEQECRKHAGHHWQCKNCAEACAECIRQCKAFLAA